MKCELEIDFGAAQPARGADHRQKTVRANKIVRIAGRNQESDGAAKIVGQRVDLGRLPAARAADGIVERSPFAPVAERCALT